MSLRLLKPDTGFWLCVALVGINAVIIMVAPYYELRSNAAVTLGACALGAFLFWIESNRVGK